MARSCHAVFADSTRSEWKSQSAGEHGVTYRGKNRWGVVLVVLFLSVSPASALDLGEWVAGLKLSPFISERIEYETNIFQVPSGAQDDVIFKTVPGFLIDYTVGPNALSLGYRAEILRFATLEGQDAVHHIGVGQIRLELPRTLVNLRDDFTKTSDPPGTELTGRIKSTTNTLAPEAEYKLTDRFSAGLNYAWTHVDFERTVNQLDRDEHLIGGSVFWKFLPKTDLRLSYNYGQKNFDSATERDVTRHVATVGLRGDLTARLSSTFRAGFESRDAERSTQKDFTGYVVGGDWTYKPTDRTTLSLITNRSVEESTFGNTAFFVSTTGTLLAEHTFVPKVSANARLTGGVNEYPTKETLGERTKFRKDTLSGWGAGVDYDIQPWLRVGAEYSHTRRISNFNEFNFADDKITGRITLQF